MSILKYGIKKAIESGDICVRKQPIIQLNPPLSVKTGEKRPLHHYEVLTLVSAELSDKYNILDIEGLIDELEGLSATRYLDEAVTIRVLSWLAEESNRDMDKLLHVNVHPDTINRNAGDVVEKIRRALDRLGISHSKLCFEITENTLLENPEMVVEMIDDLRSLGCKIALDDFGKKMLNLSTLKILQPDFVKIDGEYVQNSVDSEFDRVVIRSLVELSRLVGAKTIAEKVETKELCYLMRALGVDYGQGWYFSKGMGLEEIVDDEVFTTIER